MEIKTLFIIAITTARMIFPGIPAIAPLAEGEKTPESSPATRSITLELSSDKSTDTQSVAYVTVPEGVKAEKTALLHINLSKPAEAPKQDDKPQVKQVKQFNYWGSGEKIPEGQPKITEPGSIDKDSKETSPTTTKRPTSFAYWPDPNLEPLPKDITIPGTYTLDTNYCGKTQITLGKEQGFLAPIELVNVPDSFNFEKPIKIEWKPVPGVLGYVVSAYGGNETETVSWTNGTDPDLPSKIDYWALGKSDVEKYIEKDIILRPTVNTCTIPAGVFKGASSALLTMTALGEDILQDKDGIKTQVVVRSTISMPLFSKPYMQRE